MGDVEKTEEPGEPKREEDDPWWFWILGWIMVDDHPIDRPMKIIVVASLIYLLAAYFEFVKVVIPLGDHIPFSFAYLQANVPCEVMRFVPYEGLQKVDTICQRGVHYGYDVLWLLPVLVGGLAVAYRFKQWGVFYWPLLPIVGFMLLAHVIAWPFVAFDDASWLADAQAQHPNAVDAFFGWEGILTNTMETLYAVVCAYAVFRLWQERRKRKEARLVDAVKDAMKSEADDS